MRCFRFSRRADLSNKVLVDILETRGFVLKRSYLRNLVQYYFEIRPMDSIFRHLCGLRFALGTQEPKSERNRLEIFDGFYAGRLSDPP